MTLALYRSNIPLLGDRDVIIATYPGSGTALVGNVLHELNLNYVDPYTEILQADGSSVVADLGISRNFRRRLIGTQRRDSSTGGAAHAPQWPRFAKSHVYADEFADRPLLGAWIIVRDPRDSVFSWYQWRRGFLKWTSKTGNATFQAFLEHVDGRERESCGRSPIAYWSSFYRSWLDRASRCKQAAVLRFEDLKAANGHEALWRALRPLDPELTVRDARRALDRSNFEAMRKFEDSAVADGDELGSARVMRKGEIGGWSRWMTKELAPYFGDPDLVTTAAQFGYEL